MVTAYTLESNQEVNGAQRQAALFQREVWRECKYGSS